MIFEERKYQQDLIKELVTSETNDLLQASTGSGKSYIFSEVVKQLKGRRLILVHREELLVQTCETLNALNVDFQPITAKIKKINLNKSVFVAMVATLGGRKSKDNSYLDDINTIIIDEAHRGEFDKVIDLYPHIRRIGFTASPVRMKRTECLKDKYDRMVKAPPIQTLIDDGYLVKDINYALKLDTKEFDKLKVSTSLNSGGYTTESLNTVFNNGQFISKAYKEYVSKCDNKKTIVFCCSVKHAEDTHQYFQLKGVNSRCYSSKSGTNRKELMKWFKETDDAVLINVDVFTTGLDVTDIMNVILFRSTRSLAMFIQMVGRGGRTTKNTYKDHFNVIDLGNNIEMHKHWSYNHNWDCHFIDKKPPTGGTAPVKECPKCEALNMAQAKVCYDCNYEFPKKSIAEIDENGEVVAVNVEAPKINTLKQYHFNRVRLKKPFDTVVTYVIKQVLESTIVHSNYSYDRFRANEVAVRKRLNDIFLVEYNLLLDVSKEPNKTKYYSEQLNDKINQNYGIRS